MIDRSVLVHYRTEEAKSFRREHGDRGGANTATSITAQVRGRDPDNPSDRKHPSNGRFCQRMEINGGVQPTPSHQ